jgi:RecA/RadA recombinase
MYMFLLLLFFYTTILFQVKIVIVDSVTFHFRQDFDDMALRTRLLSGIALKLMKLAKEFSLAVRINLISL